MLSIQPHFLHSWSKFNDYFLKHSSILSPSESFVRVDCCESSELAGDDGRVDETGSNFRIVRTTAVLFFAVKLMIELCLAPERLYFFAGSAKTRNQFTQSEKDQPSFWEEALFRF